MAFRDLIPWSKNQELAPTRENFDPFITLHREMNRLFDDVFRGFGSFGPISSPLLEGRFGWPKIELSETDKELTVSAELPGMTEKDVQVEIANGVLTLRGEKKAERTDNGKYFSERYYGAFERRIALDGVAEDKAQASFRDGVLTITLPKSEEARESVKRIPIGKQ
ncbi:MULTISPECIES: Hsp20/alpha crystallin family protein [Bradyrhizobium]|jgi:HSP20 family protein|uniref:Hsp20/alpha crystallin family protein n=1 Tax=Bradyrhizobium TaxID=374 RepID=UPI00102A7D5F|nr:MULTISPECIES: Hsp20/alpha crystallin family protein [Bradyrhizobium]MBO4225436.1 Hsp20 family protein [Bradyrhizobium neotropicale]RZN33294.1 heat-shock protein [Bradyrhizobium sp. Leo121]